MVTRFREIIQSFDNKTIVCYGIPPTRPYFGIEPFIHLQRHGINPSCYADSYRYGEEYCGKKIISPNELLTLDRHESIVVVIYCSAVHEVFDDLTTRGLRGEIFCLPSFIDEIDGSAFLLPDEKTDVFFNDIPKVRANLSDNVSQNILDAIIEGRKWLSPKSFAKAFNLSLSVSGSLPFFIKEVMEYIPEDGIAFIDCGAYDGDTILAMVESGIQFKNTFCFEPDEKNHSLLLKRISKLGLDTHVSAIKAGVWNKTTQVYFNNKGNDSSHVITETGGVENTIDVVAIDDFFTDQHRIDMIKMDIEGAELEALQGAIKTIKRERPILAVCLYHKFFDLARIPLFLMEQLENYNFLLRQHDGMAETILYGLPR